MLKNRPIVAITIGYIIGILMGLYCKISIVFLYVFLFFIYLLFKKPHLKKFKLISIRRYFPYIKIIITKNVFILILISSVISNSIVIYRIDKYNNFVNSFSEKQIQFKARIVSNPIIKKYNKIYTIKANNKKYFLNVKKNVKFEYGDTIVVNGIFNKPKERRNYKGFNYKEYLQTQGIYGTINSNNIDFVNNNKNIFNQIFLKVKNLIQKSFKQDISNVLLGVFLGYTNEINKDIKESFNESNISHILAVSGMHIGYLLLFCSFIFDRLVGKKHSNILIMLVLALYINIVGFSTSVIRAAFMTFLAIGAKLTHKKSDMCTSLSISLLCLLIYNPFSIRNVGLLFSYIATIGIITYLKIFNFNKKIINNIGVTISATIFILPITAIYFNKIPIMSISISVIIGILVGPVFILTLFFISFNGILHLPLLANILSFLVKIILTISKNASKVPFNKIYVKRPSFLEILSYYVIVFLSLFLFSIYNPKRKYNKAFNKRIKNLISLLKFRYYQNKKKIISMVLIIVFFSFLTFLIPKNLKINFIDVGQGDSCLIVTPHNKKILIDGGGSENYDVGKNTLIPYLLARKIKKIDYIIISHFDTDHVGGILSVMKELKVKKVIISKQGEDSENFQKFNDIVREKKIKVEVVNKGDKLKIEKGLYFDILWPNSSRFVSENILNNNSIVCKLQYKNFSMLFTGDIEKIAEKRILQEYKNNTNIFNSTVLKVAHHGSKTSSIQEFLDVTKPTIAVIGVGENNKFGHPNEDVIKRLENLRHKNI